MIAIRDLDFRYPHGAFRMRIDRLEVARGEAVAVIGPSGSGKTTLLNLAAGVMLPRAGAVVVDEAQISRMPDRARRRFRITRLGMVFQEFELVEYLPVLDNILLPYRINSALTLTRQVRRRAVELAGEVGIADKLNRYVHRLSQGERQRVAICRALLTQPTLILADEPTGNLDPRNKGRILDILLSYQKRNEATLLTVTHDHSLLPRFDRTIDFQDLDVTYNSDDAPQRAGKTGEPT